MYSCHCRSKCEKCLKVMRLPTRVNMTFLSDLTECLKRRNWAFNFNLSADAALYSWFFNKRSLLLLARPAEQQLSLFCAIIKIYFSVTIVIVFHFVWEASSWPGHYLWCSLGECWKINSIPNKSFITRLKISSIQAIPFILPKRNQRKCYFKPPKNSA